MCDTMVIDWIWKWHPLTFLYQPLKFSLKWGIWESQKLKKLLSQDFLGYKRLSNPSQSVSLQRNQHGLRNSNGWITSKRVQGYPKRMNWFQKASLQFSSLVIGGHLKEEFLKFLMVATANRKTTAIKSVDCYTLIHVWKEFSYCIDVVRAASGGRFEHL